MWDKMSFEKHDRFDLEQAIMECWNIVEDIKGLYHTRDTMSEDNVDNYLLGLQTIYEVKFNKLFKIFEDCAANYEFKPRKDYEESPF